MATDRLHCRSMSGATPGVASLEQLPDGRWRASYMRGSPVVGKLSADLTDEQHFANREEAIEWLRRHRFEVS